MKKKQQKRAGLEIEKNGRKYQLVLPEDATIGEAYDAAYSLLLRVLEVAKENAEKVRPKEME